MTNEQDFSAFKWIDTCRRVWNALDDHNIDPDDCGLCFQCPHIAGKKKIVQCTGLDLWLCDKCWSDFAKWASDSWP